MISFGIDLWHGESIVAGSNSGIRSGRACKNYTLVKRIVREGRAEVFLNTKG